MLRTNEHSHAEHTAVESVDTEAEQPESVIGHADEPTRAVRIVADLSPADVPEELRRVIADEIQAQLAVHRAPGAMAPLIADVLLDYVDVELKSSADLRFLDQPAPGRLHPGQLRSRNLPRPTAQGRRRPRRSC